MFKNFYAKLAVSRLSDNNATERIIVDRLARQLADSIVNANVKKVNEEFYTTYEMKVIITTEEDFFRAVSEYVQKAETGYPMTIEELSVK